MPFATAQTEGVGDPPPEPPGPPPPPPPSTSCLVDEFDRTTGVGTGAHGTPLRGLDDAWYSGGDAVHVDGSKAVFEGNEHLEMGVPDQTLPVEFLMDLTVGSGSFSGIFIAGLRGLHYAEVDLYDAGGSLGFDVYDDGSDYDSKTVALLGVPIRVRMRVDADSITATVWAASGAEPGSPTTVVTNVGWWASLAGEAQLELFGDTTTTIDRFEVVTGWPNTKATAFTVGSPVTFDDFNRSVSGGWGTPSVNTFGPWTQYGTDVHGSVAVSVDGSKAHFILHTDTSGNASTTGMASAMDTGQYMRAADGFRVEFDFAYAGALDNGTVVLGYASDLSLGPFYGWAALFSSSFVKGTTYKFKGDIAWGWFKRYRWWKASDPEPSDWFTYDAAPRVQADALYLDIAAFANVANHDIDFTVDNMVISPITVSTAAC